METGRPSRLNESIATTVVAAIQRGAYIETAAALAGVPVSTFYDWLKRGKAVRQTLQEAHENEQPDISAHDANCANFSEAVEKAIAQAEVRDLQAIDDAAQSGQWQAAAWKLERKHHSRWGRKVAVTDNEGGNFFAGMARAWAEALGEDSDTDTIPGTVERPRLESIDGNGAA